MDALTFNSSPFPVMTPNQLLEIIKQKPMIRSPPIRQVPVCFLIAPEMSMSKYQENCKGSEQARDTHLCEENLISGDAYNDGFKQKSAQSRRLRSVYGRCTEVASGRKVLGGRVARIYRTM